MSESGLLKRISETTLLGDLEAVVEFFILAQVLQNRVLFSVSGILSCLVRRERVDGFRLDYSSIEHTMSVHDVGSDSI